MAGNTRGNSQFFVEATPTIDTSAYASGDSVGAAAIELTGVVPGDAGNTDNMGGLVQSVVITDLGAQSANLDVVFFDANPTNTTFTDNAALDIDDADLPNVLGVASVTDWKSFSDNSVGQALQLAIPFVLDSGHSLYAAIVSRGAPTYVSTSDLTVRVGILATP